MSSTDNWFKLYRWWQEHLKSHDHSINRRPSLTSFCSSKNSQLIKLKKRASYSGITEYHESHNDFRHVRDSIRRKDPQTTRTTNNKRLVIRK
jgi:hypothetical protein